MLKHKIALEFCFTKEHMYIPEPEAKTVAFGDYEVITEGNYSLKEMLDKAIKGYGKPKSFRFVLYGPTEVLK